MAQLDWLAGFRLSLCWWGLFFFLILMILQKIINLIYVYSWPLLWLIVLWGEGLRFEEASSRLTDSLALWFHAADCQFSSSHASLCSQQICQQCWLACAIWGHQMELFGNKSRGIFFLSMNLVFRAVTISKMMSICLSCKLLLCLRLHKLYDDYFWVWELQS